MIEELEKAAERLAGLRGCYVDLENAPVEAIADMWRLAQSKMDEMDATPVDEEWFISVGAKWTDAIGRGKELCLGPLRMLDFGSYACVVIDTADSVEFKTRGQVRWLCRNLDISSEEVGNAEA